MKYYHSDLEERIGYDFYVDIAEQIIAARGRKKWTQKQLADALKWPASKIARIELVQIRITLKELKKLAECLDTTVNGLIRAELDSQVGNCLYLVWSEKADDFKLYAEATSKRLAFLNLDERLRKAGVRFLEPRDRARVKLVGVPLVNNEIRDKFPARKTDEDELEPSEDDK